MVYNVTTNVQRFYNGHDNDIKSLSLHAAEPIVATGQIAGPNTKPHIRIWRYDTLDTISVIGVGSLERAVTCLAFSPTNPTYLVSASASNALHPSRG